MAILLQYSCLENSMDRGAWWAIAHGAAESDKTEYTLIRTKTKNLFVYVRDWPKSSFGFSCKILQKHLNEMFWLIWCRFILTCVTMTCPTWPCMAWLIASLSYPSPFDTTRLWSIKGLANPLTSKTVSYPQQCTSHLLDTLVIARLGQQG